MMKYRCSILTAILLLFWGTQTIGALGQKKNHVSVFTGAAEFVFSDNLDCTLYGKIDGVRTAVSGPSPFCVLILDGKPVADLTMRHTQKHTYTEHAPFGKCGKTEISFYSPDNKLEVALILLTPARQQGTMICLAKLRNGSAVPVRVEKSLVCNMTTDARKFGTRNPYDFWSFQGGTYPERYDWVFPVGEKFARENFQGMNSPDYGGGMPVVDLWTARGGIAIASLSVKPELISLPVRVSARGEVSLSIKDSSVHMIGPGESLSLTPAAVIVHDGDYFNPLRTYSRLMQQQGLQFPRTPAEGFEPEWCAWGYLRDFNKQQILATLDKVKELGFKWVTIDDGWQNADGDWQVDKRKFPGGEKEFREFIRTIKKMGLKVRLWWVPFETHDSAYNVKVYPERMNEYGMKFQSRIAAQHPDWFLLNKDQSRVQVTYWNSYLLCPAWRPVAEHFRSFIEMAIKDWGVDGFKVDGQNFNAVSPCYNPLHHHKTPQDACKAVPEFMKKMFQAAVEIDSEQVVQLCPCGTNFSIYNLPATNQTVASDPVSSWQVRTRCKTYKALYGDATAFSGDHIELTAFRWNDREKITERFRMEDFASVIGIGGVPASKFTIASVSQLDSSIILSPEKEAWWKKWLAIYEREKPSLGEYMNLYDIAFDKPETHAIRKQGIMYYSFFSEENFTGTVQLRGLAAGTYEITDVVSGQKLKTVTSGKDTAELPVSFSDSLILKAVKIR